MDAGPSAAASPRGGGSSVRDPTALRGVRAQFPELFHARSCVVGDN